MKVFGVVGWSGSGKTTLVEKLIAGIVARGVSVSSIKHAHMDFDIDRPGKDSHRHRMAGAREVLVSSRHRWALLHELRGEAELDLESLLARLAPVDLVLIEGFKFDPHPKLEVHDPALGKPLLAPQDPHIVALAWAGAPPPQDRPVFARDDHAAIAGFILERMGLG
jgi:molybdopterin-guanine dinucleotide biosynthesis adapter protein